MKIAIASDGAGYELKVKVMEHLRARGTEFSDLGPDSDASCDYPVYAKKVCEAVKAEADTLGILVCGTGIGMSMAANKEEGIRAAVVSDCFSAKATREHNDANVLCLGGRVIGSELANMIVDLFIDTPFSEAERHVRRIRMFS